MRIAGIVTILLFGLIVATAAQDPVQFRVEVQSVGLDVFVDTAAGKPITNLPREDFTVFEDGEPRDIRSFEPAENPYNILLLFDRSSSTEDQWPLMVRAISAFMAQFPPQHRVALAAFDEKPEMLLNWRSATEFVARGFQIETSNSGTNVYGALEWAARELEKVKGRKGVIVYTDGVDNRLSKKLVSFDKSGSPVIAPIEADSEFQKMLRTVAQSRAPVYFVAVNTDKNPDPGAPFNSFDVKQRAAARLRMEEVANRSNGALRLPQQARDVTALYETIGKELGHSYNISFAPGKTARDGSYHRIEVRIRDKSLRVTQSRDGYYAR